jgi:hypothetical protein
MRHDEARRTITVVGCVQQEAGANDDEFILADARPAAGSEAGAVGTTGTMAPPPTTDPATDPTTDPTTDPAAPPSDTTDRAATYGTEHGADMEARSYELTGDREDDLKDYVGKRVEIVGTLEDDDDDAHPVAHGSPTTDATAPDADRPTPADTVGTSGAAPGAPGAGADEDRDLPRLKITSVREVSGTCPAPGDQPDRR